MEHEGFNYKDPKLAEKKMERHAGVAGRGVCPST